MPRQSLVNTAEARKMQGAHKGAQPSLIFGPDLAARKPDHMRLIGECIVTWTAVETYLAVLLSALLHADTDAVIALYATLRRASPRHEAIVKAAEHMLDARGLRLTKALLIYCGTLEAERNDLVHGWWGISFEIDDGILWAPQERVTLTQVDHNKSFLGKTVSPVDESKLQQLRDSVCVYRLADLTRIKDNFATAMKIISEVRGHFSALRGDPPLSLNDQSFDKLSSFAPIQEGLEVLRRREERQNQKASAPKPSPS